MNPSFFTKLTASVLLTVGLSVASHAQDNYIVNPSNAALPGGANTNIGHNAGSLGINGYGNVAFSSFL